MSKLISLFRRTSADGFESLIAPYIERLYRLAYRFCGEVSCAEDLVQDLLLKLYPRVAELARLEEPGPWLSRALYNHFIDTTRREKRTPFHEAVNDQVLVRMPGTDATPEQELEQDHLQRQLLQAMAALRPEQRALVSLHDIEGYTLLELETMLGTPLGTLKSRLHRSRKQLRESLQTEPFSADERVKSQRTGNDHEL